MTLWFSVILGPHPDIFKIPSSCNRRTKRLQLGNVQSLGDSGTQSQMGYFYQTPPCCAQRTMKKKRDQEDCKNQNACITSSKHCLPDTRGLMHIWMHRDKDNMQ